MIEIHGHRGFRGRWPENTLVGFLNAINAGATGLEMDVVVSADKQLVVSHEPWMAHTICLDISGNEIPETEEKSHNFYKMAYGQIRLYNCGSKQNPSFPEQTLAPATKPLLKEVIEAAKAKIAGTGRQITYNIEIKSSPEEEGEFYPSPEEFVRLLLNQLALFSLPGNRVLVQSFDHRILQEMKRQAPDYVLGLLVEKDDSCQLAIERLGFMPHYLNPFYLLVTSELISFCQRNSLKILPWTLNSEADMLQLLQLGVTGLITDFPDKAAVIAHEFRKTKNNRVGL